MAIAQTHSTEECKTCKSPTKETSRSLCTTCLNKNLQRACETKTVVCSATTAITFRGVPRALFPGMPRAILGPVNLKKGHHISPACCRTKIAGNSAAPSTEVRTPQRKSENTSVSAACKDSHSQKVEVADEIGAEGRSCSGGEQEKELKSEEAGVRIAPEKWHMFQIQKNLTVRIPNPPMDISMLPGRCQMFVGPSREHSHNSLPPRKEARPRAAVRPSHVKRSSIKPNARAEAELMMRLLSDSMPILKSTATLVLPPCEVRPAPISPMSPPGDPLWKRRCIPCPKSLKVQVPSICAN